MTPLDRNEVRDLYMKSLRGFLGTRAPDDLNESIDPFNDLGLDSEDGVDFACELSKNLGFKIPNDLNPWVDDVRHRALRFGESIDLVCQLIEQVRS